MFKMKYVTVKEMKELDSRAIKECGIPAAFLMENAGKAIAAEAVKTIRQGKISVFCGYGNNGGDGFVAARHLLLNGYPVEIFLTGKPKPFSPETEANYQALVAMGHTPLIISSPPGGEDKGEGTIKVFDDLPVPGLVIDAIFGIGVKGILDEFFIRLIDRINGFGCPVIAADVPSGLGADTGKPLGTAIKAIKTVTMGYPKIGFRNPAAKRYTGEVICVDIGLPDPPCHSEAVAGDDLYKSILDNLFEGVYFIDRERRISYWNKGAERITGYRSKEVVGSFCRDNILSHVDGQGVELCRELCPLARAMLEGTNQEAEVYLKHKDGHRVPVLVRGTPLRDSSGEIVGAVEVFSDISAKNRLTQRLEELSKMVLLDPLTGMGNRRFVEAGLNSRLNELQRYGWKFGLLFIDIDHFKKVNDSYGHGAGDLVLKMVAGTLVHNARSFDLIGRWGGEEFVAIITNVTGKELFRIAQKYRVLVEESNLLSGKDRISVTISVGAALARPDDSPETLVKRADQLMYQSKLSGRNCVTTDS